MNTTVTIPFHASGPMLKAVQIALFHERCPTDYKQMSKDGDYHNLIKELWENGDPFIINEHDIIPWPGAIAQIDECDHPWCTFFYRAPSGWVSNGLGLVKFDPSRLPEIFEHRFEKTHWQTMDVQIARRLKAHNVEAHTHTPAVTNLNPWMFYVSEKKEKHE